MKFQILFSREIKKKNISICRLLKLLPRALSANMIYCVYYVLCVMKGQTYIRFVSHKTENVRHTFC